jgi:hypothetical protein
MKTKLLVAAQAVAICAVIAVLAWSKARGLTLVLPYFPHVRKRDGVTESLSAQKRRRLGTLLLR